MFLGAGNPERKWGVEKFMQAAEFITENYGLVPVLCGGPDDSIDAEEFVNKYKKNVVNLAGKTTLLQLMELLNRAEFLISVDTGALHIAAAVNCMVFGLYSGKFYGRFAPYPKEITKQFYPIYPDFVDTLIAKSDPILFETSIMKNDTIKQIGSEKVIAAIKQSYNK